MGESEPTQLPLILREFPDGAHWVRLLHGSKRPDGRWRDVFPAYPDLLQHVGGGGNGGVVPASADWRDDYRLVVLDVDHGRVDALTEAYPPVALAKTTRGAHAWYVAADPPAVNATWAGPGGTAGDYRALNGYAALHGDELAIVDAGLVSIASAGRSFGVGELPSQLLNLDGRSRETETPTGRLRADVGAALKLFEGALKRARRATLKRAVVGARHGALVRELSRWAGRRQWNGRAVDDAVLACRCAGYWLGFPDRQTFPVTEAAGILAWVLAVRAGWQTQPHTEPFIERQRARGYAGRGKARMTSVRDDASNEAARPWDAAGVSRATWYRRRSRGMRLKPTVGGLYKRDEQRRAGPSSVAIDAGVDVVPRAA